MTQLEMVQEITLALVFAAISITIVVMLCAWFIENEINDMAMLIVDEIREHEQKHTIRPLFSAREIGREISDVINQDVDDVTDGEVVDQIIEVLRKFNVYYERS